MGNVIAVIGAQFGDEGKGKIVDYLSQNAFVAVRYNGGANAGHSVETDSGIRRKVHLFPSAAFIPHIMCIIGNGMVVDPFKLIKEKSTIETANPQFRFGIDWRAHVLTPFHQMQDIADEEKLGEAKIGTTKSGNGPAYSDKMSRTGIQMHDLLLPEGELKELIMSSKSFSTKRFEKSLNKVISELKECGDILGDYFIDGSRYITDQIRKGRSVIFAGAHGTMLDIDHGTYPFVTSSSCSLSGIGTGAGVSPKRVTECVGVVKAYTTRVGAGAFPTEVGEFLADKIRKRGNEYGTTTGRARRIGWLDIPMIKHAARINGFDYLAITLLDVLSIAGKIDICLDYKLDGETLQGLPMGREGFNGIKIVKDTFPSWREDIGDCRTFSDLPDAAQDYVRAIENYAEIPVGLISVGPKRSQIIDLRWRCGLR